MKQEPVLQTVVGLKESHVGQIERGEILISLRSLDKIANATGVDIDFFLYGKNGNKNLDIRKNIDMYLNRSDKDELNYIIDDIQNELWSDDTLLYDSKDISFSEFTKTDAFYNVLVSLTTVKSFIDTLKDEELSKCFKTDNDMLMTVGQLKERISENYDIALEEIYKNKEEIER